MFRALLSAGLVVALAAGAGAKPARKARHPALATTTEAQPTPQDDLYRRRGYGQGGLIFGGAGQGGLAQAGACADLAFVRPSNCGPAGHYGAYGNGIGYGFGF